MAKRETLKTFIRIATGIIFEVFATFLMMGIVFVIGFFILRLFYR